MGKASKPHEKAIDVRLQAVIADDDPFARRVIKDVLTASGVLVVAEARDGREAVEFALYFRPDAGATARCGCRRDRAPDPVRVVEVRREPSNVQ